MQTTTYKLNVTPGGVPLTIHISQYDVGLRQYTFQPYTTVGEFSYVSGATVTLEATKPDGYAVIHECDYNQDGSITYTVQAQLAAKPGRVWSKVVIRDGSDVLGTGAIIWVVDYAGVKDNAIISDSDISALQQWMDDVEDYAEQADGSAQAAASAVSLAESAVASAQEAATQAAGYVDQAVILGGTPLVAATVSAMTNHDRVYVYTGSETGYTAGNWYYWNGSAWTSGGIYNSSAVQTDPTLSVSGMAADAAATGELKNDILDITPVFLDAVPNSYKYIRATDYSATIHAGDLLALAGGNTNACYTEMVSVRGISHVSCRSIGGAVVAIIAFYDADKNYLSANSVAGNSNTVYETYEANVPTGAAYVRCSAQVSISKSSVVEEFKVILTGSGKNLVLGYAEDITALQNTSRDYVYVVNNTSMYGDGGSCLFSVRDGETMHGIARSDGSVVYPLANQSVLRGGNAPYSKIMRVIRSYVGKDTLTYGSAQTLYSETCGTEIDCSSFVTAVLNGVTYNNSRYALGTSSDNVTGEHVGDTITDTSGGSNSRLLSYRMAQWFAMHKQLYLLPTNAKKATQILQFGDVLFSASGNNASEYYGIDHVMIVIGVLSDSNAIIVAQAGGSGTYNNESTVVKTSCKVLTNADMTSTYRVFARPSYAEDDKGKSLYAIIKNAVANNKYLLNTNTGVKFQSNTILGIDNGRTKSYETYGSTSDYYDVLPSSVIEYTGNLSDGNNRAFTAYVAQYDADYNFIERTIILSSAGTHPVITLTANTHHIRFSFGHATSGQLMALTDFDNFEAAIAI